ncbi:hypothetical protein AB8878_03120 [Alphaproteobacteria bacterium LSUCC0226]
MTRIAIATPIVMPLPLVAVNLAIRLGMTPPTTRPLDEGFLTVN